MSAQGVRSSQASTTPTATDSAISLTRTPRSEPPRNRSSELMSTSLKGDSNRRRRMPPAAALLVIRQGRKGVSTVIPARPQASGRGSRSGERGPWIPFPSLRSAGDDGRGCRSAWDDGEGSARPGMRKPTPPPSASASPAGRLRAGACPSGCGEIRGKRMARPDLWRVERAMPSKATSKTRPWSGSCATSRTGPKRSTVLRAHEAVDLDQLLVGEAEIGLADGHQRALPCPDAEGVVGIEGGALAVAALGVHQHRVDDMGIALPLEPMALGAPRQIGAVEALEHQALDGLGIRAGAGRAGSSLAATRSSKVSKGRSGERSSFGGLAVASEAPRARRGARRRGAGAGPRRPRPGGRRRGCGSDGRGSASAMTALRFSRCCSTLKLCTSPSRSDQELAVDGGVEVERLDQVGEGAGNVLAGARVETRGGPLASPRDGLDADAVPLPFGGEVGRVGSRDSRAPPARARASPAGTARGSPVVGLAVHGPRPRRRGPHRAARGPARSARSSSAGAVARARRRRSWRGAPRRRCAAPPVISLSSAQRPVSSSASSRRASIAGRSRLGGVRERLDDLGEGRRVVLPGRRRPHQRDGLRRGRRHSRRTGRTAPGSVRSAIKARISAGLGVAEGQVAGDRGEGPAAVGVGRLARNRPRAGGAWRCGAARRRGGRGARRSGSCRLVLFLAIADHVEGLGREALALRPVDQRVLLAVGDPELGAAASRGWCAGGRASRHGRR